ncbi:nucleotidyltransferase family protein [Telmatospirillum siberiense]|uniref:Mannose-1-phosphate guanylyltransferase n=1 Tax=Telmatospirillum siberiense TaxID=382514 RepID=A0A2N3PM80_9PROT|nr:nucleotidyltransferase family protein [Telmatospirillum siberiense]PKU21507.1 mannose-1-phosphate guanylyltransferase [Telmatospirillum siberiense]
MMPSHAMLLAAGLGLRMRPLTLTVPKPLIPVAGRTMLDRILDHLDAAGVGQRVVNTHWLGETLHRHLAGRIDIVFSDEAELLETGGGVLKALPLLGADPFFVCNADIVWTNGPAPALGRLADAWDGEKMDALLLMQRTATAFGYDGPGDFFLDSAGRATRRREKEVSPTLFAGVQILHPRLFSEAAPGKFSLNRLYDRAEADGRLYGIVHDGGWYHIGTPDALAEAEDLIGAGAGAGAPADLLPSVT